MSNAVSLPDGILRPGIRVAKTDEERCKVFQFRYKVYVEQQGKSIRAADHTHQMVRDDMDDWGFILYAEREGQVVATACLNLGVHQLIPEHYARPLHLDAFADFPPSTWSITLRLMIEQRWRAKLILPIIESLYPISRFFGSKFNFIYCAPHLVPFFQRLGFRQHAAAYEDQEVGVRVPMVLLLEDIAHMEHVRSPFTEAARKWGTSRETAVWFSEHSAFLPFGETVSNVALAVS